MAIEAPPRLMPAPLEGVMTPALCLAAAQLDLVDGWITPFWRVSTGVPRPKRLKAFLEPFLASGKPVRAQLMGTDAELLAATAARLIELGAAGVNLNFACPSKQVCSSGAGGGLWRQPRRMAEILGRMRQALPDAELSVKLRTGWDSPGELAAVLPELIAAGRPDWLAVHHRTVAEQYRPVAPGERLERWRRAVELAAPAPVWINGDLEDIEEAERLMTQVSAAGALAGRGWLRDPWFFRRPGAPEPEEGREIFWKAALAATPALSPGQRIELGKWLFRRILAP